MKTWLFLALLLLAGNATGQDGLPPVEISPLWWRSDIRMEKELADEIFQTIKLKEKSLSSAEAWMKNLPKFEDDLNRLKLEMQDGLNQSSLHARLLFLEEYAFAETKEEKKSILHRFRFRIQRAKNNEWELLEKKE